jgi:subtilisin family serine protease
MRAVEAGSVVVGAAGNDFTNGNPAIYPADYPHVLTVGATDKADRPARFTSASLAVDVVAPGIDIPVQNPADPLLFGFFSGTSFAAPIVSAAAAWLWTMRPDLDSTQLAEVVRRSARDLGRAGHDKRTGFGLLSIPDALSTEPPAADPLEPNDDIDLVTSRGIFGVAKPSLTGPANGTARIRAGVSAAEDPADVYRVYVPAGKTLDVLVTPKADVGVTLWHPRTQTVHARAAEARENRLATSNRRGVVSERLRWRNASRKPLIAYLEVWLPRRDRPVARADYVLRLELTKA